MGALAAGVERRPVGVFFTCAVRRMQSLQYSIYSAHRGFAAVCGAVGCSLAVFGCLRLKSKAPVRTLTRGGSMMATYRSTGCTYTPDGESGVYKHSIGGICYLVQTGGCRVVSRLPFLFSGQYSPRSTVSVRYDGAESA